LRDLSALEVIFFVQTAASGHMPLGWRIIFMKPDHLKAFWGNHIRVQVDQENLDFVQAKDIAKEKAKAFADDPMLLSWYNGKNGEYYPRVECGRSDKPVWIVFAESRGADMAVDINEGEYIFLYLSLV